VKDSSALTNWFGDRIPCFCETAATRLLVRVACYALRILLRVSIEEVILDTPFGYLTE